MTTAPQASALIAVAILLTECSQTLPERPVAQVCSQSPREAGTEGHTLAAASQSFGLELTRLLALNARDNVFIAPLSAQLALAMGCVRCSRNHTAGYAGRDRAER